MLAFLVQSSSFEAVLKTKVSTRKHFRNSTKIAERSIKVLVIVFPRLSGNFAQIWWPYLLHRCISRCRVCNFSLNTRKLKKCWSFNMNMFWTGEGRGGVSPKSARGSTWKIVLEDTDFLDLKSLKILAFWENLTCWTWKILDRYLPYSELLIWKFCGFKNFKNFDLLS